MAQTVLESPAVAVHRQDRRNPCPDAQRFKRIEIPLWQYTDREVDVPAWQDRASPHRRDPYGRTLPETVEIPQVQFVTSHERACDSNEQKTVEDGMPVAVRDHVPMVQTAQHTDEKCSRPWSSHQVQHTESINFTVVTQHQVPTTQTVQMMWFQ